MGRWPDKYVIGLTGNIATGKSIVRKMLEHLGAFGLDADGLARQAMQPGAPAYKPVVQAFGRWILTPDNRINRAALAKVVFTDPAALARLESVTHPVVHQAINILVQRSKRKVIVIEAIKLLEAGWQDDVDAVWVVDAPPEAQLKRLMAKRKMPENTARMYMQAQAPQAEKIEQADVVIDNRASLEDTWKHVQAAWGQIPIIAGQPKEPEHVTTVKVEKQPEPVAPKPAAQAAAAPSGPMMDIAEVTVRRGTPKNADEIAEILSKFTNAEVTRMDVMMAFGEKAYLLAKGDEQIIGIAGMQVENLITRVDEFYVAPNAPPSPVVQALTQAVEENSHSLESEVAFFFLPNRTRQDVLKAFEENGYEHREVAEIKVPAWRESASEAKPDDASIYAKKLRSERVLKPL